MYVDDATLEQIDDILQQMVATLGGDVKTALIVGLHGPMDGVMLTAKMPYVSDEDDLGNSFVEVVQIAQEMSIKLGRGSMQQVKIMSKEGPIFISPILDVAFMVVVSQHTMHGYIIAGMEQTIERIVNLLPN